MLRALRPCIPDRGQAVQGIIGKALIPAGVAIICYAIDIAVVAVTEMEVIANAEEQWR